MKNVLPLIILLFVVGALAASAVFISNRLNDDDVTPDDSAAAGTITCGGACSSNDQCNTGLSCTNGRCKHPLCITDPSRCDATDCNPVIKVGEGPCGLSSGAGGCESGSTCQNGKCVATIDPSDGSVDGGQTCGQNCRRNRDCADGSICNNGKCINPICKGSTKSQCANGNCTATLQCGQADCRLGNSTCPSSGTCNQNTGVCECIQLADNPHDPVNPPLPELPRTGIEDSISRILIGIVFVGLGFYTYKKYNHRK